MRKKVGSSRFVRDPRQDILVCPLEGLPISDILRGLHWMLSGLLPFIHHARCCAQLNGSMLVVPVFKR
eukprot:940522-Pleurochrysis_carterae.AAC.1